MIAGEYMTNGCVAILGHVGRNFGAGMSGGEAFLFDADDNLLDNYNPGMVELRRVALESRSEWKLRGLLREHVAETGSPLASHILANWQEARDQFWHVVPNVNPSTKASQALLHVPRWNSCLRVDHGATVPLHGEAALLLENTIAIGSGQTQELR